MKNIRILLLSSIPLLLFGSLLFLKVFKQPSDIYEMKRIVRSQFNMNENKNEYLKNIKESFTSISFGNKTELIDSVRKFVNAHSIHRERTKYHRERAFLVDSVLKDMWLLNQKKFDSIPHLSCGPRAYAMHSILRSLNIPVRIVMQIYPGNEIKSHTTLEVFNDNHNRWELQDPDLNVYFKDTVLNERISMLGMKNIDETHYAPCKDDSCTWDHTYYDYRDKKVFAVLLWYHFDDLLQPDIVMVDSKYLQHKNSLEQIKSYFSGKMNVLYY